MNGDEIDRAYDRAVDATHDSPPRPTCPLCGWNVHWGWDPGDAVICGNCGARVKPVPFAIGEEG